MYDYSPFLSQTYLFNALSIEEIDKLLHHLQPRYLNADKGQLVGIEGQMMTKIGVLLEGKLLVYKLDREGDKQIIDKIQSGDIFAEAFVCAQQPILPVMIEADSTATILWLDYQRLLTPCHDCLLAQMQVIRQLLANAADKLINLRQKLMILQKNSLRGKLLGYFSLCAERQKSQQITLPFNRYQLADYLGVNRSALSRELSHMKQQGLIDYNQDKIELLAKETA